MDVSDGALAGYIHEKELYTAGVKAKLNKSFLIFCSTCFWHHSFLKNILIQPGCFSYMVHIYFQSKTFSSSETIFVSSYVISGLYLKTLALNQRSRLDHLRTSATKNQGSKGVQMLSSPVPVPISLLLLIWRIFRYIWKARSILQLRVKTKWNPLSQGNEWDVEQKINWSSFDKR